MTWATKKFDPFRFIFDIDSLVCHVSILYIRIYQKN